MSIARSGIAALATAAAAVVATGLLAGAVIPPTAHGVPARIAVDRESPTERTVDLAAVVAAWPDSFVVTGTKSEPLYVEHVAIRRDGGRFELTIDVRAQGSAELGVQHVIVVVNPDGQVARLTPCPAEAPDCLDEPVRGFLSTASLVAAERQGRLPATGVIRDYSGIDVTCVADDALHPASPSGVAGVDPCFSVATGAVLAHWSPASSAFTAATLAPDLVERVPDDR